jgi:hypothetical protein
VFGDAAARDVATRMHALFYTSPLRETEYALGRFLGALTVNAVLLLGVPLGLLLASVMPYMAAGKFGPVQLSAYVQAYVMIQLPNLVLVGVGMFAAALRTRHPMATYVGGIALYLLGGAANDLAAGTDNLTLAALADPFGAEAVQTVTRFWTPSEQNTRLIGWPALVLWNRVLWLAVALAGLAFTVAHFRFTWSGSVSRRRWWRRREVVDTAPDRITPIGAAHALAPARSFSFAARARQTLAVAMRAWREIAATRAFLVILAGALFFVFAFGWDVGTEIFGTSTWPVTHLIAGTVLSTALGPVIAVLIVVFAGELVWRERDVGMGDIADVAPIPDTVALLGRFLALVAMLVVLQAVLMGAGMLLQALRGYTRFEPLVYVQLLFGVKLVDYVLLAVLAMALHVIVNHKYIGHLVAVLYIASTLAPGFLGIRQTMAVYGADPGWIWSDLAGLAPFVSGLVWFKLYWAAWALLLAVLARVFWSRGRERDVARRLVVARQRLTGPTLRVGALAVLLVLSLGGFVFYNTNVLNEQLSPEVFQARAAEYERRFKRFESAPRPNLTDVRLRVELYPRERAAELRGTLRFVNRGERPIDSLHVLLHPDVETREVTFDRAARQVTDDPVHRYRIYALERSVAPGDSLAMTFEVAFRPRGFRNEGAPTDVTANGTYVLSTWIPAFGYQAGRELKDPEVRRAQGLPPRTEPPSAGDVDAREVEARGADLVTADVTIGTEPDQTAITPGALVREWRENGRRYFRYRTTEPTRAGVAVLSARYAVRESEWNGIPLRVYHHAGHDVNVDRMIRGMRESLAYYTTHFGPYQFRELRIVELPRYVSFARAHPHTIAFSEGSAFLTRIDSGAVDRTFVVVAHETAHQWWGGQVIPVAAKGAPMASETLAQYSAMMVLETVYGRDLARQFYDYLMDEYLRGRSVFTNREAPLVDVEGQSYVYYMKGAVAMYTLRDRLGADAVNRAVRSFRDRYAGADAPPATSRALLAELAAVTPDSLRPLLSDLFEHITLWDVKADSARAEPVGGGAYRVTLHVTASKARADSVGRQTPIPMDDLVEVGVFTGASGGPGETLHLAQHRLRDGQQTITITVPRAPARAGVDPYRKFIERERDDNMASVAMTGAKR